MCLMSSVITAEPTRPISARLADLWAVGSIVGLPGPALTPAYRTRRSWRRGRRNRQDDTVMLAIRPLAGDKEGNE